MAYLLPLAPACALLGFVLLALGVVKLPRAAVAGIGVGAAVLAALVMITLATVFVAGLPPACR
jgi:hypothetical protein